MYITFELNGKEHKIKYDGFSYQPMVLFEGGVNKRTGEISENTYERPDGYHKNLAFAVKRIIDTNIATDEEIITLMEYVERYESAVRQIKEQIEVDI